jgi:hypothetical protein
MEPEGSLPCTQDPATGTYLEPDESNPHIPIQLPQDLQNYVHRCIRGWFQKFPDRPPGAIAILWVNLVSFAAITLCVASQQVFIVVSVYFVMDSVRKLLDTPSYSHVRSGTLRVETQQLEKQRMYVKDIARVT